MIYIIDAGDRYFIVLADSIYEAKLKFLNKFPQVEILDIYSYNHSDIIEISK